MSHPQQIDTLIQQMRKMSSTEARAATEYFIPGVGNHIGLRMPQLNALAKEYKNLGFEFIEELFLVDIFDCRMLAVKILPLIAKKNIEKTWELMHQWRKDTGNWAICDTLGSTVGRILFKKDLARLKETASHYIAEENQWSRRLGLVLLLPFSKDTSHHPWIKKELETVRSDKRKYSKKAVIWIERELQKKAR